jgi:hypothetical protein
MEEAGAGERTLASGVNMMDLTQRQQVKVDGTWHYREHPRKDEETCARKMARAKAPTAEGCRVE